MILRIVLLGALAVAAIWVANRPGRVQIDWLDYRIELSLAGLVLLLLLLVALLLLLGRLWRYLRHGFWRERTLARQRRGYEELTWGLSALAAGDASLARKHARKFAQLTGNSALSDLLEGQAALLEGDLQTAKLKFSGLRGDKRSEALGLRGLLSVASRQGDEREALDLANDALKRLPQADWARAELLDISLSLGAWDDAEKALERMIRKDELSAKDARHQRAVIKLLRAHEAEGRKEARLAARLADEALDFDSALAPARALRARLYRQAGKTRRAIRTLKEGWSRAPHPLLAEEWMDLHPEESHTQRYKSLQGLTDTNPTHAESHAVLTRYALEAGLNGGARRHAEALKEREPSERAFDLLAQVEEAEGHIAAAEDARRRRADAEENPAWRCSRCGHEEEDWSERCGGCGAFATIEWVRQEPQHFAPGSGPAKPGPSRAKADTASPGGG